MLRIKNRTFERYLRQRSKKEKELSEYKKELRRIHIRAEKLQDIIRDREDLVWALKEEDSDGAEYIKHKGVLLYVRINITPNYKNVIHHHCSVSVPGNDFHRYAKIYTNANDNKKFGCEVSKQENLYSHSKRCNIGHQFTDFHALVGLCKDWVTGCEINNYFCGDCIVKASCTTDCGKQIQTMFF